MASLVISFLALVDVHVSNSAALNCNFVMDYFDSYSLNPPSLAPTASPSDAPTPPTTTPTRHPTVTNGTHHPTPSPTGLVAGLPQGGRGSRLNFDLRPYIPNGYCYSVASDEEPFNSFSYKYECIDTSLKRTMYYDNLDCSGSDMQETMFYESSLENATFQCSADVDCNAAAITIKYASNMV